MLTAAAMALVAAAPVFAQAAWDRRVEEIGIVHVPSDPAGTYRLSAAWVVEASGITGGAVPLDTKVSILVNGTALNSQVVAVSASAGCEFCPTPNTCVCAEPDGPCSCTALWLTTSAPGPIPLAPGAVVTIMVAAATGAAADQDPTNNTMSKTFNGTPSFWNRRIVSADLVPSPCPGAVDLYDLSVSMAFDFSALPGQIELDTLVVVSVNGAPAAQFDACADDPWITTGVSCIAGGSCGLVECGSGSCAGANVDLDCQLVEIFNGGAETCVCSSGQLGYFFPGVSIPGLNAQSVVKCNVVGALSSGLAEIPALGGDDSVAASFVLPAPSCAADINKDGKVDAADLGLVLSAWGECK